MKNIIENLTETLAEKLATIGVALCVALGVSFPETPAQAQSLGQATYLQNFTLAPESTNLFQLGYTLTGPGNYATGQGINTNSAVFIPCGDVDYLGMTLQSFIATNGLNTNVLGMITARFASTIDGMTTNNAWLVMTLLSTGNTCSWVTNSSGVQTNFCNPASTNWCFDSHGLAGWFLMSLESTNMQTGGNGPTNFVTLKGNPKAAKTEAVPSTYRN